MKPFKTVHLMDDDPADSLRLKRFLQHFGYHVTRHASARELLQAVNDTDYSVVLANHAGNSNTALQLQSELASGNLTCPVIFMAAHADIKTSVQALKAGAADFLEKPVDDSSLLQSLRTAFSLTDTTCPVRKQRHLLQERYDSLTPREQEIMRHVVSGVSNRALAARLEVSIRTVEVHRSRVMKKMGADSLPDLVRLADLLDGTAREQLSRIAASDWPG